MTLPPENNADKPPGLDDSPETKPLDSPLINMQTVALTFAHNGKRVRLPLDFRDPVLKIGRGDPENPLPLDLAPYDARELGVSRVHAQFLYRNGMIWVEDLGSTNGTRINGFELSANKAYRLRSKDELEFGQFRVVLHFA